MLIAGRTICSIMAVMLLFLILCRPAMGGCFLLPPEEGRKGLSAGARNLVERSFADLGEAPLVDYHAHLLGTGTGGSGAEANPDMFSWRHPIKRIESSVITSASGVRNMRQFDQEYVSRLVRLARSFGHLLKIHLLALDRHYNADGTANPAKTDFYVPNEEVVRLAEQYPDIFVPVISIHPARPDALIELDKWAKRGARYMKWLPNAQGIDPGDRRYDPFYRILAKHRIVLLCHCGEEKAAPSAEAQELGNPLRLRRPLDLGVTVIAAHAASLGTSDDLDHPGMQARNFDLCLWLLSEERYRRFLFIDISGMTIVNRLPGPLLELIRRPDLHGRMVNGSDYPLPAVNAAIWTSQLLVHGMITTEERKWLNEIYRFNPLLFDYVVKRTLRDPRSGARLPAALFLENPALSAMAPWHK